VGAFLTSVPPLVTWSLTACLAKAQRGRTVSRSIGMLPAVPISACISPPVISCGVSQSSREPSVAPFVWALQNLAAVLTASRCWGRSPG